MRDRPTFAEFLTDAQLLGLSCSPRQLTVGKALYGEPLDAEELEYWRQHTGRATYPGVAFPEGTIIAGARSGKDSRIAVPVLLYEAVFGGHEAYLGKGEHGTLVLVAQDHRATRTAFGYARGYMTGSSLLRPLIAEEREAELWLTNRMRIACFASSAKSIRGWSIPAAVMDELAFFRLDAGADADVEIQTAIRRGGVGFPHPKLLKITTPYLRAGVAFEDFSAYYAQDSLDVLVWRASTAEMNPTIDARRLAREQRVDAPRFAREYLAEFGDDIEAFLPGVWIESVVIEGRRELPPDPSVTYTVTVDPSGGSVAGDEFALNVLYVDGDRFVQVLSKGWSSARGQQVNLSAICAEIAEICRRYRTSTVIGDHYAGEWPKQEFQKVGLFYKASAFDKSACYLEFEPQLATGRVELLDDPVLTRQLRQLERRYKIGGKKVTIDHPKGGHDDRANALALGVAERAGSLGVLAADVGMLPERATPHETKIEAIYGAEPHTREPFWRKRERTDVICQTQTLAASGAMSQRPRGCGSLATAAR